MKKSAAIILALFLLYGALAAPAFAQVWSGKYTVTCNQRDSSNNVIQCTFCDALKVIANIVNFFVQVAFSLAALVIVYGALLMMMSGGSEERFRKGKGAVMNAVIGIVITLSSWLIVNTILNLLDVGSGFLPWSEITC